MNVSEQVLKELSAFLETWSHKHKLNFGDAVALLEAWKYAYVLEQAKK